MDFRNIMNSLSKEYLVPDANVEQASLIFILESPHVQEVKNGVPVAGASGATMTKHLVGAEQKTPLGLLVKKYVEHNEAEEVENIGLMNICQLPMQRAAYQKNDIEQLNDFFDIVEGIRTSNHKKEFKDETWNDMQKVILNHFLKRLKELENKSYTLVPCGRFAQKFFQMAMEHVDSSSWKVIDDVPHPSYNSWSRERYRNAVKQVQEIYESTKS
ncbi:hypothetical protein LC040_06725 [Bacillus tianshenii]|nr:hypothetical protein LC040_06725 [Bacillus tianshenii]